jgi:hypothetical protein
MTLHLSRPRLMTHESLVRAILGVALGLLAAASGGCTDGGGTTHAGTADAATTVSCYTDVQFVCEENPTPTATDEENLRVVCSSNSGVFAKPAACPTAGFLGKCTFTSDGTLRVRRYYPGEGVDVAYLQDFCVNTAHGVWSTTF